MRLLLCLLLCSAPVSPAAPPDGDAALIKERYIRYLIGTEDTFTGRFGKEAHATFLKRLQGPIRDARAFDDTKDAGRPFRAFPDADGYRAEARVYELLLQRFLPALAFGYCVKGLDNPHYRNPEVLQSYLRCLTYLHGRGIRAGMTFHYNENRMRMDRAPRPSEGAANLVAMELRMGSLCQSLLLMEPHIRDTAIFREMRALVRHLEMLGRTSGHTRYYEPGSNPPEFRHRVQSDAIQNFADTTLVSALLEDNPRRQQELLTEAGKVYTDSLKVIPGWADTIKPDFVGYHHRGIYGNAYTGGFIPQAAFGVHVLRGTRFAVAQESIENLKQLILTYRLYSQKYALPIGIRGRMPLNSTPIKTQVFPGILTLASPLGLDDTAMKPVFARLWDAEEVGLDFLFTGGRGKLFRGFLTLDMLEGLVAAGIEPEPDPEGFWSKPYGGLAIHRRDDWMAAVKGYSAYIWDYECGKKDENVYGQYFSHGSLTLFSRGDPVSDLASGYDLDHGWDWHRMPGTTAVHFPLEAQGPLAHRRFSPETFLGAASADGRNGVFGMILQQKNAADGTPVHLHARKSLFFVDDLLVLLGSGISGGNGEHPVETTLFQSRVDDPDSFGMSADTLVDPSGNAYLVPDTARLMVRTGLQKSFDHNGRKPSAGNMAVAWVDHGLKPVDATYHAAILVKGAGRDEELRRNPDRIYKVLTHNKRLHRVAFPGKPLTGYCCFRAGRIKDPHVAEVSAPCLIMVDASGPALRIGLAHPDLGLVDRDVDLRTIDYRFISRDEHLFAHSRPRPVELTLHGAWTLASPHPQVAVASANDTQTVLRFNCTHGRDLRVSLEPARPE